MYIFLNVNKNYTVQFSSPMIFASGYVAFSFENILFP